MEAKEVSKPKKVYKRRDSSYDANLELVLSENALEKLMIAKGSKDKSDYIRDIFEKVAVEKINKKLEKQLSNPSLYVQDDKKTAKVIVRYFSYKKNSIIKNAKKLGRKYQDFSRAYVAIVTKGIQIPEKKEPKKK